LDFLRSRQLNQLDFSFSNGDGDTYAGAAPSERNAEHHHQNSTKCQNVLLFLKINT